MAQSETQIERAKVVVGTSVSLSYKKRIDVAGLPRWPALGEVLGDGGASVVAPTLQSYSTFVGRGATRVRETATAYLFGPFVLGVPPFLSFTELLAGVASCGVSKVWS